MAKRTRARTQTPKEEIAETVHWFGASRRGEAVLLALLTESGPGAYSMSPGNATLMADALREAARAAPGRKG